MQGSSSGLWGVGGRMVSGLVERSGEPLNPGAMMAGVGQADVTSHLPPVSDLPACGGVRVGLAGAPRKGVAVEVLELRGQLADDAGFAFGGQLRQRQVRSDERLPVTHRRPRGRR